MKEEQITIEIPDGYRLVKSKIGSDFPYSFVKYSDYTIDKAFFNIVSEAIRIDTDEVILADGLSKKDINVRQRLEECKDNPNNVRQRLEECKDNPNNIPIRDVSSPVITPNRILWIEPSQKVREANNNINVLMNKTYDSEFGFYGVIDDCNNRAKIFTYMKDENQLVVSLGMWSAFYTVEELPYEEMRMKLKLLAIKHLGLPKDVEVDSSAAYIIETQYKKVYGSKKFNRYFDGLLDGITITISENQLIYKKGDRILFYQSVSLDDCRDNFDCSHYYLIRVSNDLWDEVSLEFTDIEDKFLLYDKTRIFILNKLKSRLNNNSHPERLDSFTGDREAENIRVASAVKNLRYHFGDIKNPDEFNVLKKVELLDEAREVEAKEVEKEHKTLPTLPHENNK